jgi:hypothetical protein
VGKEWEKTLKNHPVSHKNTDFHAEVTSIFTTDLICGTIGHDDYLKDSI